LRPTAVLLLGVLLLAIPAGRPATAQVRFAPDPPQELVVQLMAAARSDLSRITGAAGAPNESLLERNQALLSITDARAVIDVGFASGRARWCGLDWRSNLQNLVNEERARQNRSERQIAYIGALHAHAMAVALDETQSHRCTDGERTTVTDYIRRRWQ